MKFIIISYRGLLRGRIHPFIPRGTGFHTETHTTKMRQGVSRRKGLRTSQKLKTELAMGKCISNKSFSREHGEICRDFTQESARTQLPLDVSSAPALSIQPPGDRPHHIGLSGSSNIDESLHVNLDTRPPYMNLPQSSDCPLKEHMTLSQHSSRPKAQSGVQVQQSHPKKIRAKVKKDLAVPPSAASGGIPEPHPLYLFHSTVESRPEESSQPKLLVIDLNGTLLCRKNGSPTSFKTRPSAKTFLNFVLENFKVMIWSSATAANVREMCRKLISEEEGQMVLAEWSRDHLGLHQTDYLKRVQVYKRLWRIWDDPDIQAKHPFHGLGLRWSQYNTILIDDSIEKARSEPHNLVQVPEYNGHESNQNALKYVAEYLYRLRSQTNVSAYIRTHPFKMPD
jgi:NLI interacting factor-like phosphatase